MTDKNELQEELERLKTLGGIVVAFEEIATNRIQRIRDSVLRNRSFLQGIDTIYFRVKNSYKKEIAQLQVKHNNTPSFLQTNGKTVSVLFSANTGLYGDIINRTYELFSKEVANTSTDIVIIGKLGAVKFQEAHPDTKFTYVELTDNNFTDDELAQIAALLIPYTNIILYHGLFKSIVEQVPVASNVSGDDENISTDQNITKWIFEPSLEGILEYFQKQIFSSNLTQTMHEAQLAKLASRTITLENARTNIENSVKETNFHNLMYMHRENNRKQLNALTSRSLWKTR